MLTPLDEILSVKGIVNIECVQALAHVFTHSPLAAGTWSHRSWPQWAEAAAGLGGGERGPASRPDKPSSSGPCCRVRLLHEAGDPQPSGQPGRWEAGRSRCGRGRHGSWCWGSGVDQDRDP